MKIVGASESLKCKLMSGKFKDVALRWYMSLPRLSITSYQDLTRKMIHHFSSRKHRKVNATSMFNILQRPSETLRVYMVRFNVETIKVSHPNQEMFVGAFQNGLKVDHSDDHKETSAHQICWKKPLIWLTN